MVDEVRTDAEDLAKSSPSPILAHEGDARRQYPFREFPVEWREAGKGKPDGDGYLTCSWCGSLTPQDALTALAPVPTPYAGMSADEYFGRKPFAEFADEKYGYPHKIYVDFGPRHHAKFYVVHLRDIAEVNRPLFDALTAAIARTCLVQFAWDERGLSWRRLDALPKPE